MGKKISVLGSTGSIGTQSLEVIDALGLSVAAITGNRNVKLLEYQARRLKPEIVVAYDRDAAAKLKISLGDTEVRVACGDEGLIEAATCEKADIVITAVVGTVGLRPTLEAIRCGKRIALANKETLVCAGDIVMEAAREYGADILPVDSEHSAIFQCLNGDSSKKIKRILLTASGGPFKGRSREEMETVTREDALRHPNWSMGNKITIDSATMMNKGLEFIEAMYLFDARPEQIEVLVHPQSIVHSMIEFEDNSILGQMGVPDMKIPIQLALTWPDRCVSQSPEMDFAAVGNLTFEKPDFEAFPMLRLAMDTAGRSGSAPAVMNASNEAAVELFLDSKIGFTDIYSGVSAALRDMPFVTEPNLEDILELDRSSRRYVLDYFRKAD